MATTIQLNNTEAFGLKQLLGIAGKAQEDVNASLKELGCEEAVQYQFNPETNQLIPDNGQPELSVVEGGVGDPPPAPVSDPATPPQPPEGSEDGA